MRGQAALEYLSTYGWAFMIILVMIGAFSYMGATNTNTLIPDRCQVPTEFSCVDFQLRSTAEPVVVILKNNMKGMVWVSKINFTYDGDDAGDACGLLQEVGSGAPLGVDEFFPLNPGLRVEAVCDGGLAGFTLFPDEKAKVEFEFVYKKTTDGFAHQVNGDVVSTVS